MNRCNQARCSCGLVTLETSSPPLLRGYCHCTICQKYSNSEFADISVYRASDIEGLDESKIVFKVFKKPPLVRRGSCIQCGSAAFEKVAIPLMPKLIIVPNENFNDPSFLPSPSMHIFYETRISDADDSVKKYSGFLHSQLAFSMKLIAGMVARSRA